MERGEENYNYNRLQDESLTPEEKLLKIIENPDIRKAAASNLRKKSFPEITGITKKAFDAIKKFRFGKIKRSSLKQIKLSTLNFALAFVCAVFTLYWIFNFVRSMASIDKRIESVVVLGSESNFKETKPINIDTDKLSELTRTKNIFSFSPPSAEASVISTAITSNVASLKLVGILWSDNPQAMLEDSGTQKTYFLSAGETIKDIKVKEIFKDRITLEKDGQEFELR